MAAQMRLMLWVLAGSFVSACSQKVCIFDIDMTLTRGAFANASKCNCELPKYDHGWPGVYAKQAVEECLHQGFQVGISTAEPRVVALSKQRKEFLRQLSPRWFNETFFASELMQYGNRNKTTGLVDILRYTKSRAECAIFFDDKLENAKYAEAVGINYQQASDDKNDGRIPVFDADCGLNSTQFVSGMRKVYRSCNLTNYVPWSERK
uniref:Acid phosphatase n=1 Tax=Mucochytrium quahogii TaxID=96639 RepID=A0A7S2WAW1_9STRA|mmetsp:Transcript_12734/g.20588  ORF Transcript_12734/g.20588 Transcript_12734/m.20588 type:complete len:207 (+) Transcript_12734:133-753(+)